MDKIEVLIINTREDDRQEWLALPTDAGKVRELFDRLGLAPGDQSYRISTSEGLPFPELSPFVEGSYTIDGLNWLAARLGELDAADMQTVRAAIVAGGFGTPADVAELTHNTEYYVLLPGVHDRAALGRYYLNDSGMVDMPEGWKAGIDPFCFGEAIAKQEGGVFTPQGYLVQSGDKWKEIDRAHVPEAYRVEAPAPVKERPQKPKQKHHGPEL